MEAIEHVETQEKTRATGGNGDGPPPEALLSVQDLRVWFELRRWGFAHAGYVRAVDGVSFDLRHGEAIGVVGESGCGKTTLMKTILGLYQPTEGDVVFDGTKLGDLGRREMRPYRVPGGLSCSRTLTARCRPL